MRINDLMPILAFVIVLCIGAMIFDRCSGHEHAVSTAVTRDTVIVYDTVRVRAVDPADVTPICARPVTLPVWQPAVTVPDSTPTAAQPDSATVVIPMEQRHYAGENYDAWISGYQPSLDSLNIYHPTATITETQTVTRWRTRRWGLSVGSGVALTPRGLSPGIFAGVTYTFVSF